MKITIEISSADFNGIADYIYFTEEHGFKDAADRKQQVKQYLEGVIQADLQNPHSAVSYYCNMQKNRNKINQSTNTRNNVKQQKHDRDLQTSTK